MIEGITLCLFGVLTLSMIILADSRGGWKKLGHWLQIIFFAGALIAMISIYPPPTSPGGLSRPNYVAVHVLRWVSVAACAVMIWINWKALRPNKDRTPTRV